MGKVIASLSDKKRKTTFVPYRDSKLTKLLMDSLGGTSMTLMIACCSPSEKYLEETLSTLKYATRARSIENKPVLRVDPKEQLIYNLRREAKLLKMFSQSRVVFNPDAILPREKRYPPFPLKHTLEESL